MIFENVLKEGVNMACKAGVFRCAIDLDFRLTESWGESKNDSNGEVACPSSPGRALKKRLLSRLGLILGFHSRGKAEIKMKPFNTESLESGK